MRATPEPTCGSLLIEGRAGCLATVILRDRVVVVVGGVMSIQGDGNHAHKAKDHSRGASRLSGFGSGQKPACYWRELSREGEPDALKGARPVREGLHRDRLFERTSMAR